MAEAAQHRRLVAALLDYMHRQGVAVTHATGTSELPDPPRVGRHEPHTYGTKAGVPWIGEAKTGDGDLFTQHSLEQLKDFSHRVKSGTSTPCPFVLCVPKAAVDDAHSALRQAGADLARTRVIA
jgi:hypothetical protein